MGLNKQRENKSQNSFWKLKYYVLLYLELF